MNKKNSDITNDIYQFLLVQKKLDVDTNLNTKVQDLGLDSIDYVTLLVNVEEKFEIEFGVESLKMDCFETISDIVEYIQNQVFTKEKGELCRRE